MKFTLKWGYFIRINVQNSIAITDSVKVKLLELSNIPRNDFIYPFFVYKKGIC